LLTYKLKWVKTWSSRR